MKKKIFILLCIFMISIPFQKSNVFAATSINSTKNVVAEYCEIKSSYLDYSKKIRMPFKIKQNSGQYEKTIDSKSDCDDIHSNTYYDWWHWNLWAADNYDYPVYAVKYSGRDQYTTYVRFFLNDDYISSNNKDDTKVYWNTAYHIEIDSTKPIITDSNSNTTFELGTKINISDITDEISCNDVSMSESHHDRGCSFVRIDNFSSIDSNKVGKYQVTLIYEDNYGNQASLNKEIVVEDSKTPKYELKNTSTIDFEKGTNLYNVDISDYFDISTLEGSGISSVSSNISSINSNEPGIYDIKVTIKNTSNNVFYFNHKISIIDMSAPTIDNLYGLYDEYTLEYGSDLSELKYKLENELDCFNVLFENETCFISANTDDVNTNEVGNYKAKIILSNEYGNEEIILVDVEVIDKEMPEIIQKQALIQLELNEYTEEMFDYTDFFKITPRTGTIKVTTILSSVPFHILGVHYGELIIVNNSNQSFTYRFRIEIISKEELGDSALKGVEDVYITELYSSLNINDYLSSAYCENTVELGETCSIVGIEDFDKISTKYVGEVTLKYILRNRHGIDSYVTRKLIIEDNERPTFELDKHSEIVENGKIIIKRNLENYIDDKVLFYLVDITSRSGIAYKDVIHDFDFNKLELGHHVITYKVINTSNKIFEESFNVEIIDTSHLPETALKGIKEPYIVEYGTAMTSEFNNELFKDLYCENSIEPMYDCFIKDIDLINTSTNYLGHNKVIVTIENRHGGETSIDISLLVVDTTIPKINKFEEDIVIEVHNKFFFDEKFLIDQHDGYIVESISGIRSASYEIMDGDEYVIAYEIGDEIKDYDIFFTVENNSGYIFEYRTTLKFVDTTPPQINSFDNIQMEVGIEYLNTQIEEYIQEQDYSDNHNLKEHLRYEFELIDELDITKVGNYEYLIKIYDLSNNVIEHSMFLNYEDTTAPELYLEIEEVQLLLSDKEYNFIELMVVNDNSSDTLVKSIKYTNIVLGQPGDYEVHLQVEDDSNNKSYEIVYVNIANIQGDLIGNEIQSLEYGDVYQELGMTAHHGVRGNISSEVLISNELEEDSIKDIGEYKVYYYVYENDKLIVLAERLIEHVDTTSPIFINLKDTYEIKNNLNFEILEQFQVSDNYAKEENDNLEVWYEGEFNVAINGTYKINVHAEDSFSNLSIKEVTITVNQTQTYTQYVLVGTIVLASLGLVLYKLKRKKRL